MNGSRSGATLSNLKFTQSYPQKKLQKEFRPVYEQRRRTRRWIGARTAQCLTYSLISMLLIIAAPVNSDVMLLKVGGVDEKTNHITNCCHSTCPAIGCDTSF